MKLENILVPVDFSLCSKNALKVAIDLAKKTGAKIHMINAVFLHAPHPDISGGGLIHTILSDYENQVKESFDELKSELIELKEVPNETEQFIAALVDAIFSATQKHDIDLIVMGTRSEHTKIEHFLGSHTTDVIQSAKVPVLVIPEDTLSFHPSKIGLATDFETMNLQNLKIIQLFAQLYDTDILAFHITEDIKSINIKAQKTMKEIHSYFEGFNISIRTIESDKVVKGIQQFTNTHELDMLATIPKEHSFIDKLFKSSVTKKIALDLEVPLLTIQQF